MFTRKRGAAGWPRPQAEKVEHAAQLMGLRVKAHYAQTGTIYLNVEGENNEVKIRVADHGECYCTEDISCDPDGVQPADVINWLARKMEVEFPPAIERRRKAAETKRLNKEKRQAERTEYVREILLNEPDIDLEYLVPAYIPKGSENRKSRRDDAWEKIHAAWELAWGKYPKK